MRNNDYGIIDIASFIQTLPEHSERILIDRKLVSLDNSGARIIRFYNPAPLHYHAQSDTYLYILSGKGRFQVANQPQTWDVAAGALLFWKKGVFHGYTEILEQPLIVLALDSPMRNLFDIVFYDPTKIPEVFLK